jgi:hypothetical protein
MKNKKSSDGQIIQRPKIVRIGKARRSPTEQRIAFYFTFSELAKSSVLDLLVLLYQDKRTKKKNIAFYFTCGELAKSSVLDFLFLFIKKKNIKINLLDNSKNQV